MRRLPLRRLLLAPVMLSLALGAVALGVYVERSFRNDLVASVDAELDRAMNVLVRPAGPESGAPASSELAGDPGRPGPRPPAGTPLTEASDASGAEAEDEFLASAPIQYLLDDDGLHVVRGAVEANIDPAVLVALGGVSGKHTVDGDPGYRVATQQAPQGETHIVAISLDTVDESLTSLRQSLLAGGLVLVLAQVLAVWLIASVVARPVTRMSRVAHEIAEGDLDAAVGPPRGSSETAALATDLGRMLDRLKATIADERHAAAEAEQARTDMARFVADASHELRTPLTALKGYSELYRGGMLDAEGLDRAMDRIGSESERLIELVIGLLNLMKDDDGEHLEVDVVEVAERVVDDIGAAHPERSVTVVRRGHGPLTVLGNPDRLHQAVLNLVANACQHTESAAPIEVVVSRLVDVEVSVVDHGDGIDVADPEHLFAVFARGDESRSRKSHDGAGLGLAMVRRIAEQHGGSASVRETPGGGATFSITLPPAIEPPVTDA